MTTTHAYFPSVPQQVWRGCVFCMKSHYHAAGWYFIQGQKYLALKCGYCHHIVKTDIEVPK